MQVLNGQQINNMPRFSI